MTTAPADELDDALEAHVQALVDQAPPLTPARRDRLRQLLQPVEIPRPRREH